MKLTEMIANMIGTIALIDLIALIIQGSKRLSKIRGDQNKWLRAISLGVIGGLFGIYATISGVPMANGAVITVRDVGPMMAGCFGGPLGGLIAGVIAGVHRLLTGLPDLTVGTTIPCAVATVLIGLSCGLLYKKFQSKKRHALWAILIGMTMEVMHLLLVFIYFWGYAGLAASAKLISEVAAPFLIANGIAFGLLVYVIDMVERYKQTEQHEKQIETELNVATSIQDDMLPSILPDFPGRKEFTIDASMDPAKEIGGDFYDFFFIDEDHFVFLIADVSGKGVPSALFMVISKTIIKNNVMSGMKLSEAMQKTNAQLCDGNKTGMFVTAWIGVYEISTGRLTYVNAGHNPPLIKQNGGSFVYLRDLSGLFLAGRKKTVYKEFETYLLDGDRLFLYTDGVTEAMNEKSELYGEKRLFDCFSGAHRDKSVTGIIRAVRDDITAFIGNVAQSDDITMLALMVSGEYEKITVKADLAHFSELEDFMTEKLKRGGIDPSVIAKMQVVLDEIYSNVVKFSGSAEFTYSVSVYCGRISMKMEYGGELFDITKTKEPEITLAAKDRPIGGLGLFIVKKTMDRVCYRAQEGKNILTLTKDCEVGEDGA